MACPQKWFPLETERLRLREFDDGDVAAVHEYGSDPDVTRYVEWGPNTWDQTVGVVQQWLRDQLTFPRDDVTLAITVKPERRVIGGIRLAILDDTNKTASFGYALNRRYWGQGYATEAARAIRAVAFAELRVHRLIATCDTRNVASQRVMEKIGMRREGHFLQDVLQRGVWRDSYLYAVLGSEVSNP